MINLPKISVIMPCYNGGANIENAVQSFLDQKYDNKELIIVDGKSTDNSHWIIESYIKTYSNVKWLKVNDINVTDALNIGIKSSNADLIGFLMTDDNYCYQHFLHDASQLNKYIPFDVLFSNSYYYLTHTDKPIIHYWNPSGKLNRDAMLNNGSSIAIIDSVIIRRSLFERQLLDPDYNLCSDYEFFLRIQNDKSIFLHLDRYTTCCLYQGNNLSAKNMDVQIQMFSKVGIKFLIDDLKESEYLLYGKGVRGEALTKSQIFELEDILLRLLFANAQIKFYGIDFFDWHIKMLWRSVNIKFGGNRFIRIFRTFSSPIYNGGINKNRLLIFMKVVKMKFI